MEKSPGGLGGTGTCKPTPDQGRGGQGGAGGQESGEAEVWEPSSLHSSAMSPSVTGDRCCFGAFGVGVSASAP